MNNFCLCEDTCETEFIWGALDADQDCAGVPSLSQVSGLLVIPDGAALPTDWETKADWTAVVDNDDTTNSKGKYITGVGNVPDPEKTTIIVAKGVTLTTIRGYQLILEIYNLSHIQYEFLRSLQCNPLNYVFWIENVSGHLFGGDTGISPFLTDVDFPMGGGEGDVEKAVLTINWRAKCDPPRTYIEDLSDGFEGATSTSQIFGTSATEIFGTSASEIFGY